MLRSFFPLALVACVLAGCSSSSSPTSPTGADAAGGVGGGAGHASISGPLGGHTLIPVDAVALKGVYDSSYPGIVTIFIGNQPDLCALFQKIVTIPGAQKANLFDVGFTLGATTSTSTVGVGTYTPSGNPNELDTAGWDSYDATCGVTHSPGATAETVTLTEIGATYAGTFDLTLGTDHVTGSFSAPLCTLVFPDAGSTGPVDGGAICLP